MTTRRAAPAPPVLVLAGRDLRAKEELLRQAEESLRAGASELNLRRFYGNEADPQAILDECNSYSLLGGRNLIVVADAERVFLKGDLRKAGGAKLLADYLRNPNPDTVLVLRTEETIKDLPAALVALLRDSGRVQECKPSAASARGTIEEWFRRAGLAVERPASERLAELAGFDSDGLEWCLEHLRDRARNGKVTAADVELALTGEGEGHLWNFLDQVGERQPGAFANFERLLRDEEPLPLLGAVRRRVRDLLIVRELQQAGRTRPMIAKSLGARGPLPEFVVEKLVRQAGRYSLPELRRGLRGLAELDWQFKSAPRRIHAVLFERWLAGFTLLSRPAGR